MARPLRIEFPGAVYHVTSRGDRREPIFEDDIDRLALLDVLGTGLERFDACALAWCLMGNHYHFVLQTRLPSLSLLMRHVNGVYTQRFNQRHRKVGHLFQGRFKAVLVDRDSYLLGEEANSDALTQKAGRAYADLVAAGKDVALWPDHLRQQIYLGDEAFVLRMQALASDRAVSDKEIPKAQRASPKTLQDWLDTMPSRDEAIVAAHRHSQLSLSEIARALGLSVSRVSRIVAGAQESRAFDRTQGAAQ